MRTHAYHSSLSYLSFLFSLFSLLQLVILHSKRLQLTNTMKVKIFGTVTLLFLETAVNVWPSSLTELNKSSSKSSIVLTLMTVLKPLNSGLFYTTRMEDMTSLTVHPQTSALKELTLSLQVTRMTQRFTFTWVQVTSLTTSSPWEDSTLTTSKL